MVLDSLLLSQCVASDHVQPSSCLHSFKFLNSFFVEKVRPLLTNVNRKQSSTRPRALDAFLALVDADDFLSMKYRHEYLKVKSIFRCMEHIVISSPFTVF